MSSSKMSIRVLNVVKVLSSHYGLSEEECLNLLKDSRVSKSETVKSSKYPLAFNGSKVIGNCENLRKNSGLYTQCTTKVDNEEKYCKKCKNEITKNNGEVVYGTIDDRVNVDLYEFRDKSGKAPIAYTKLLRKLKISKEEIEEECKRLDYNMPAIHFEYCGEIKKGRPSSKKTEKPEKSGKKGRPKKMQKEVELVSDVCEDIFANLVEQAQKEKEEAVVEKVVEDAKEEVKEETKPKKVKEPKEKKVKEPKEKKVKEPKEKKAKEPKEKKVKEVEEKSEEVDVVRKFEFEGKTYLKSKNTGVVYNLEQELVGKWNEEMKRIDFEDIDDEEEEDEYDE